MVLVTPYDPRSVVEILHREVDPPPSILRCVLTLHASYFAGTSPVCGRVTERGFELRNRFGPGFSLRAKGMLSPGRSSGSPDGMRKRSDGRRGVSPGSGPPAAPPPLRVRAHTIRECGSTPPQFVMRRIPVGGMDDDGTTVARRAAPLHARETAGRSARRPRSLRSSLGWLVAAVLFPLVVAGAAFLAYQWRQQREALVARLQDEARTLRRAVEREFALDDALLNALATSRDIDAGDWRSFHDAAQQAAERARPGSWIVLYDRAGQTLVNTSVRFGTPLPNFRKLASVAKDVEWNGRRLPLPGAWLFTPFETRRPSFSGIFYGPVNRRPVVAITMPVLRGGEPRYVLAVAYSSEFLANVLQKERPGGAGTSAMFDVHGRFIARSHDSERFVGRPGPTPFANGTEGLPDEGVGESLSVESVEVIYAYSRTADRAVIVGVAMPKAAVLAPARRALWSWLAVLSVAAAIGAAFAVRLWRRVGTPLAALANQARVRVQREHMPVEPSGIAEVEALRVALDEAATHERVRREAEREREEARRELRRSEQRFRAIFEDAAVGIVEVDEEDRIVAVNGRFAAMLGYARDELLGKTIHELTAPEDAEVTRRLNAAGHAGALGTFEYEKRYLGRDGSRLWFHVHVAVVRDQDGRFLRAVGTASDITDRRRAQDALRESEEKFRSVFEQAAIGIGRVGFADARWIDVNDAFCRMLGYSREFMLRTPWPDITHPEDVALDLVPFRKMAAGQLDSYTVEKRFLHADGRHVWARLTLSVARDADRRPAYEIAIIEDITGQKRAEQALRDADRRKDEFLGMLSHELRNPLAPIRSSVYVLQRADPASAQAARARAVIERQSEHLTRIVDDLLDVTRIVRGKILLHRERLDLREVVRKAVEDAHLPVESRGVGLHLNLPPRPLWADADATRITQILGNLLANARKFTHAGDEIVVTLREVDGAAELRVRDTGAGIDPALLPRLFDAFVQGERTLARSEGGLGLGLALVKGLVELHDGSVTAHSEGVGKGAEFVVTIPLARALVDAEPSRPAAQRAPTAARRVLVVDDNADAAESLAELVGLLGHSVEVAFDGPSAIAKARQHRPNVVLCDIGLPGMTGYDVARALRAELGGAVRLVAVSGYAQPEDVKEAEEAGFDAHLAKPADPERIAELLG